MSEQIEIRRARPADREALLGLWVALVEHHRRLDPHLAVPGSLRLGLQSEVDRGLARPGCSIWLALSAGVPVGFAFAEASQARGEGESGVGWIHELWVDPECRRRGVAGRLVGQARTFLAERGGRVAVRVEAANREALAFWRAQGFRERAHVLEAELA